MDTAHKIMKQSIHDAFVNALMKVRSLNLMLSDMYVQLNEEETPSLVIYDDADNEIVVKALEGWDKWSSLIGGENVVSEFAILLHQVIDSPQLYDLFTEMEYNGPFSLLYVDSNMEVIEELLNIDNENILLGDDFWEKMDKELDEFYEKLMRDVLPK